jgi:hypothetical protein
MAQVGEGLPRKPEKIKEDSKHTKTCSTLLIIRVTQIKTTVKTRCGGIHL